MRLRWRIAASAVWLGVMLLYPALADGQVQANRPQVFRLHFRTVSGAAGDQVITTNGRLAAVVMAAGAVELVDQRNGHTTLVTTAGQTGYCTSLSAAFAGPWLASSCSDESSDPYIEHLYSIATGTWRSVTMPRGCLNNGGYGVSGGSECSIDAGADWLAWTEYCWNCGSYSGVVALNASDDPLTAIPHTGFRTALDLDSPSMTARLCSPLKNTSSNRLSINSSARFFVGASGPLNPFAVAVDRHFSAYLERCGTRLHLHLPSYPMTGNSTEVLFYPGTGRSISGMFLATRKRFTIWLPASVLQRTGPPNQLLGVGQLVLTSTRLYLTTYSGGLWWARAPTPAAYAHGSG